jgi:hypothetical protein
MQQMAFYDQSSRKSNAFSLPLVRPFVTAFLRLDDIGIVREVTAKKGSPLPAAADYLFLGVTLWLKHSFLLGCW